MSDIFKSYTYVEAKGLGQPDCKTLIYEVGDYEVIIEKPRLWTNFPPPQITSIQNIDGLSNISYFLYEVYINDDYNWYSKKTDNERKYIAKAYAELLTLQENFRENVTGILYENKNNEFLLKLYDLDNDINLYFSTIEIVFLGADRKTRLPVPLSLAEEGESQLLKWDILDGGWESISGTTSTYTYEIFNSGFDVVLPGPTNPPLLYNILDGNL
jgi:hypothetical protein